MKKRSEAADRRSKEWNFDLKKITAQEYHENADDASVEGGTK